MTEKEWKKYSIDLLYGNLEDLKNKKHGLMDTKTSKIKIPVKYEQPFNFFNGIAIVKLNGKWGIIDENDNIVLKIKYDEIKGTYEDNLFILKLNGKYGIYDLIKKLIVPIKYDYIKGFPYLICMGLNNKYGFFDYKLHEIVSFIYDYVNDKYNINNKLLCVGQGNKIGFIDYETGIEIIPIKYDKVIDNEYHFINLEINGEIVCYENNDGNWKIK